MSEDDLEAQLAKYASGFASSDPRGRREREKRLALSEDDGRRRRRTASSKRTKQLNLMVEPELHRRLVVASAEQGKTMTELLEAAIGAYLGKSKGRAP